MTAKGDPIAQAAQRLVNQHGADAPIFAAMKADAHLAEGRMAEYQVWAEVCRRVADLLN